MNGASEVEMYMHIVRIVCIERIVNKYMNYTQNFLPYNTVFVY